MSTDFKSLHVAGDPLVLYNIWDAGSAGAVAKSNPPAIATGSWAMAAALGYDDGESMPYQQFIKTIGQIIDAIDLPVTVDFETGFAKDNASLQKNSEALVALGPVGINFEDRIIGGSGLRDIHAQCERISILRKTSETLFINARCDLLFDGSDTSTHVSKIDALIERAKNYTDAGANGFFVPGLVSENLIAEVCERCPLPVNIMRMNDIPIADLAALGVSRISHGPRPYIDLMNALTQKASSL